MTSGQQRLGALWILLGLLCFAGFSLAYLGVARKVGHIPSLRISLAVESPLVLLTKEASVSFASCVTPRTLGARTSMQLDGKDLLLLASPEVEATGAGCAGTTLAMAPQTLTPGLHRLTYSAFYSGRYARRAGVAIAMGPFEKRERWIPCAARIWIGQDFLDIPGQEAPDLAGAIERILQKRHFDNPCMKGSVSKAEVHISWKKSGLAIATLLRLSSGDSIKMRASLVLASRNGKLHVSVPPASIVGSITGPALACENKLYAKENPITAFFFEERIAKAINLQAGQKVRARAGLMIKNELLKPVRDLLEAPLPLQISNSSEAQLLVRYGHLDIEPGEGALLCLDLRATTASHPDRIVPGPPFFPHAQLPPMRQRGQTLRVDLSLQALNAALDAAWRVGLLDRLLMNSASTWASVFKDLTVQPTAMAFVLPPIIQPGKSGPELTLGDLRVWLSDRAQPALPLRIADLWARVNLGAHYVQASKSVQLSARLREFGLSCQASLASKTLLEPCFSDAVQMIENKLLDQPISTDVVGMVMVPMEQWLPGQTEDKTMLAIDLLQAELRPTPKSDWYQLFADVRVRGAKKH